MTPRADTGAVPLQKLAELDSAAHHLRSQADLDRRQQAERNISLEKKIGDIDTRTIDQGKQLAAIAGSVSTIRWLVGLCAGLIPVAVGAAWALGRLIK